MKIPVYKGLPGALGLNEFKDNKRIYEYRLRGVMDMTWDYLVNNVLDGIGILYVAR